MICHTQLQRGAIQAHCEDEGIKDYVRNVDTIVTERS